MPAYRFILRRGAAAAVATDVPMAGELLLDTESRTVTVGDGVTAGGLALHRASVGLGSVDNTSDANKPVSTPQAAALALKAPLASPALTGAPTCPTPTTASGVANKAYVDAAVAVGGGGSGGTAFAPQSLAGCIEWHDTTDAAHCLDASGNTCGGDVACATWLDLSGNGRDLVTPSAGADRRPIFRAAARHDLGALDTAPNGTLARYLERTANLGAEGFGHEFTLYFVRKRTDGATESTFGELANYGDANNQQNRWLLLHAPYTNGNTYADAGTDTGMRVTGAMVWGTNWQSIAFVRQYGRLWLIVNGQARLGRPQENMPTAWTSGSHALMVGGALNSQYGEFVGNALLAAFGVWPRALTVGELGQLDAWAGARYLG